MRYVRYFEKDFVNFAEFLEIGEFIFETKENECEVRIELIKPQKKSIILKGMGGLIA